jgi:hypothetical protein
MRLKELIQQSWTALRRNPMRSALTMLGITWGVISVAELKTLHDAAADKWEAMCAKLDATVTDLERAATDALK